MKKEKYYSPFIEVINLFVDVICTSGQVDPVDPFDPIWDPDDPFIDN